MMKVVGSTRCEVAIRIFIAGAGGRRARDFLGQSVELEHDPLDEVRDAIATLVEQVAGLECLPEIVCDFGY